MRYVKAVLVALVGGFMLTAVVLAVEMVHADSVTALQIAKCMAESTAAAGGLCDGYAQFGGTELPVAFVIGFAAGFAWFLMRPPRVAL